MYLLSSLNETNMNNYEPAISVIILNFNGGKLLEECISSVLKTDYQNFEVILVDNASKDMSHKKCKEKFPNIKLVENKTNLGYCEGNNVGIRQTNAEFIVILNPDTIVEKSWLKELYNAFKKNGPGLYQPKLLSSKNHKIINTAGNMITLFGFGYSKGKGMEDHGQYDNQKNINFASGACLFTSKEIMDKIGHFESFLFAYHDDMDLGWRAAQIGIRSCYVPTSLVYHAESFSFKWKPKKFYLLERNRWYCLLTHYSRKTFYKILPSVVLIEVLMFLFYLSKGLIKEKLSGYQDIIKNRKLIKQKYIELESRKKILDKELIKNFVDELEIPFQVASQFQTKIFNKILKFLAKLARKVI